MKVLLLNSSYEPISFITLERALKHIVKSKVEILANWNQTIGLVHGEMHYPATIRLKEYVYFPVYFGCTRSGILKRDKFTCQYCGQIKGKITIDHIKPRSAGNYGYTWLNCVAACEKCNNKKDSKSPEEAGMALITEPFVPLNKVFYDYMILLDKHKDWPKYIQANKMT